VSLTSVWKFIKEWAKTIAAFAATYAANAFYSLINGSAPWPQTKAEWQQYALTTIAAAVATWLARNKITQKQLDADKNVIGGVVVPDAQIPQPLPAAPVGQRRPWTSP
jgi:hypothetical protein